MFAKLNPKKIVSGKRRRHKWNKIDLDLSYITETVVAMSFPANAVIEKIYRNDIGSVAGFLDNKHPDAYYVYNMSNRAVDTSKFHDRVISYPWEDHHSPSILVLFEACQHMFEFLHETPKSVIVVNCNAGKGRTGTSISCFLIYSGLASDFVKAMTHYGWMRFSTGKGVTQPSQQRYV